MTVALMQPYFFPYLGYFNLVAAADRFFYFDTVQFSPKSWMTRNRLLSPDRKGDSYFRPDIAKVATGTPLRSVQFATTSWTGRVLGQLLHFRRVAPYYYETVRFLHDLFEAEKNTVSLAGFNMNTTSAMCQYLGITTRMEALSEVDFPYEPSPTPDHWGLHVCLGCGGKAYVNAPGGEQWIDRQPFVETNVNLGFVKPQLSAYDQMNGGNFMAGLSIIDVLLWNGREVTSELARNFLIEWKS